MVDRSVDGNRSIVFNGRHGIHVMCCQTIRDIYVIAGHDAEYG